MLYREMTANQREAAFNALSEARTTIEGSRDPSPKASRYSIDQQRLCFNVARKLGDAWALKYKDFADAI